jgi:mannose-6-phosphate isomerase-like protein (cupin superfamily)
MDTKSFVTLLGRELVRNMAPGRTAALKLLNEQTGGSVMAFEETTPAGTKTQLHLHHDSDEVMFVLSGEFSFKVGDQFGTGGPGSCVFMPRGVPHAWKNTGNEPGRALFMYTPGKAGMQFEDAQQMPGTPARKTDAELAEILRRYGSEIVGPPPFYK